MDRDRVIEAYLQRQLTWKKPLESDTLAAISKEVGISPAEMHAVKRQAKAHFTRGRKYLEAEELDNAVEELTQAMSLDPLNLEILHGLANAYNLRHNRQADMADRQKALLVAKRCVELKPSDKEAKVLISFLEHTTENTEKKLSVWTQQKAAVLAAGAATVGIGIMGLSRLPVFSKPPAPLGPAPGTIVPGSAIYESNDPLPSSATAVTPPAEVDIAADVDIPVIFDHPGIVLEARLSQLGDYQDEIYYQLHGVIINASNQELRKLDLEVEFLDGSGSAIATANKAAIDVSDAVIRPGDTHAFNLIQKVDDSLAKVQLDVMTLQQAPARSTYVPPTPINYSWETPESDTISFELASRSEELGGNSTPQPTPENPPIPSGDDSDSSAAEAVPSSNAEPDKTTNKRQLGFNAEWVIINTSDYPIRELKLKTDFYDANNRRIQSEEVAVISKNDALLLPEETRPFRVIQSVAGGYERYKVSVLEAN